MIRSKFFCYKSIINTKSSEILDHIQQEYTLSLCPGSCDSVLLLENDKPNS